MLTVKCFAFNPLEENTYLVYNDERSCGIIDPGCYFNNERKELKEFIDQYKLEPKILLNTHCHLDHVFGNKFVFENYNTILHIHPLEQTVLAYAPAFGKSWNLPFDNYNGELAFFNPGDIIYIGQDALKVLFTPGHSPGHVCFYSEAQGFVIGGDVLFRMGIGRTDLPGGSSTTLLESIRSELFALPDDVIVYPGHGDSTTIGYEKKHNPFLS